MDRPTPPPSRPSRPSRPRRRSLPALLAAGALLLTGCGLRLETEPPAPLVPDAAEEARQRATADAVALAMLAGAVLTGLETAGVPELPQEDGTEPPAPTDPTDATTTLVLAAVSAADEHLDALGGVYDPGTPAPPGTEDTPDDAADGPAGPGPVPAVPADPADLLALLTQTGRTAAADAVAAEDGALARILASVATQRLVLADALAQVNGSSTPDADEAADAADESPDAGDAGDTEGPDETTDGAGATVVESVGTTAVALLVRAHDSTGMAWEVAAARRSEAGRTAAAERARHHRLGAEGWALLAGLAGTPDDPRRSDYALPDGLTGENADATATLRALERDLADLHATLLADVPAGPGRAVLLDGLVDATRAATARGAAPEAFPGLPERRS